MTLKTRAVKNKIMQWWNEVSLKKETRYVTKIAWGNQKNVSLC